MLEQLILIFFSEQVYSATYFCGRFDFDVFHTDLLYTFYTFKELRSELGTYVGIDTPLVQANETSRYTERTHLQLFIITHMYKNVMSTNGISYRVIQKT